MPATRAATRKASIHGHSARKSSVVKSDSENESVILNGAEADDDSVGNSDSDCQESLVQAQLKAFMRSVRKLEQDRKELRRKNERLQQQLDAYTDGVPTTPRRRASMNVQTTIKMQRLEARVEELEKRNSSLNKKIKKLREKELKAEAEELSRDGGLDGEIGEGDDFYKMRKFLRRFSRWMSITTLAEEEDCPICFERLKPKKSYAMPCEHLICVECLPQISKGAEETVKCPQCRQDHPREDVDLLQFTETERWDELLKLASECTLVDYGGGDSSSEQAEEDFIDDGESRTEPSVRDETEAQGEEDVGNQDDEEDEKRTEDPTSPRSTPEPTRSHSYAESPTSEKRKRMESLALSRGKKRRLF